MTPGFRETSPDLITPNPGGNDDPLGESVIDSANPWLRIFEPLDRRVVIGRGQDPVREVDHEICRADGVPIHRRATGGGTVVLAPGMAVVALRLRNDRYGTDCWFDLVNEAIIPAVAETCRALPACRGHGDLALREEDGIERKILGASLRQNSRWIFYLGVLLVEDAVPLMERYLRHPSREPGYRAGRGHRDFCTHLARRGCATRDLVAALSRRIGSSLAAQAAP